MGSSESDNYIGGDEDDIQQATKKELMRIIQKKQDVKK